jgi:hypothetical protein
MEISERIIKIYFKGCGYLSEKFKRTEGRHKLFRHIGKAVINMSNSTGNLHTHMVSYALEELIIKLLIK